MAENISRLPAKNESGRLVISPFRAGRIAVLAETIGAGEFEKLMQLLPAEIGIFRPESAVPADSFSPL
jgi:hypothetical protein